MILRHIYSDASEGVVILPSSREKVARRLGMAKRQKGEGLDQLKVENTSAQLRNDALPNGVEN